MPPPLGRAVADAWDITETTAKDWLAVTPAIDESVDSQLPGRENGPADAYRHLLWGAELTRRFGSDIARTILETHEIQGDASRTIGLDSQSLAAAAMDRHNNNIAIEIGRTAPTWDEVRQAAREVIENSSGDGSGGGVWLPESAWKSHPTERETGEELPPEAWNWPDIDWNKRVESNLDYEYPYADETWRFTPEIDDPGAILDPSGPVSEVNPLSRPVVTWSEEDVERVMTSRAYLDSGHPGRARAQRMVRAWLVRRVGSGPAPVDATGRMIRDRQSRPVASAACAVPVQAHTRDGGAVEVEAHCRSLPTG